MGLENVTVAAVAGGLQGEALAEDVVEVGVYTTTLTILDLLSPEVIRFPYNAEAWTRKLPQEWKSRGIPGALQDTLDWERNPAATTSWKILLQVAEAIELEARILRALESARSRLVSATQEPALVILTLGTTQYRGVLSDLEVVRLRTTKAGDADIAELSLMITDNAK